MDKIEVTQADRIAAEPFFHWMIDEERVALMQAFAAHRATRTDATPVATDVAALVEVLREARSGLCAYTGGVDGSCSETIGRIDAALAPFTKGQPYA